MEAIKFHQDGNLWVVGSRVVPAGTCVAQFNADKTYISINILDNNWQIADGVYPTGFCDKDGNVYATDAAFREATDGFFVKASGGGGTSLTSAQIAAIKLAQTSLQPEDMGVAEGLATLGPDKKLLASQFPAISMTSVNLVNSEAEMLALSVIKGAVAVRNDVSKTYMLSTNSPSTLADWVYLKTPTDVVLTINGEKGNILLDRSWVGLNKVDNTSDLEKPISTLQQAEFDKLKATETALQDIHDNLKIRFDALVKDVPSDKDTLLKLAVAQKTVEDWKSLMVDADSDTIINTWTEVKSFLANVPEGTDFVAELAKKMNAVDATSAFVAKQAGYILVKETEWEDYKALALSGA